MGSALGGDTCRFIGGGRGPRHLIYSGRRLMGAGGRTGVAQAGPAMALLLGDLTLSKDIYLFPSVFNHPLAPKI